MSADWPAFFRKLSEELQWSAADCRSLTSGQWWAIFVKGQRTSPLTPDRLLEARNKQRAKLGKPPIRPRGNQRGR